MTTIVTVSSHKPKAAYYCYDEFFASCRKYGENPIVLGQHGYKGLMSKPRFLLAYLLSGAVKTHHMIFCDCWDVVFMADPKLVMEKYLTFNAPIVFNAERNLFPRSDLADRFPETGTPYRYLNSGFMVGETAAIVALLQHMKLETIPEDYQKSDGSWHHENDQAYFQQAFVEQPVLMKLDTKAELCQTLHAEKPEDFDFTGDRIQNKITGTYPMVFHANGQKEIMLPLVLERFRNATI